MFRLVDAILESNLWPLAESEQGNDLEEVEAGDNDEGSVVSNKELLHEIVISLCLFSIHSYQLKSH